jgi:N-acetylmuramoyl-L-alanine amidase
MGREKMKIVFDPGHGGDDPGAIGLGGERESGLALSYAFDVEEKITNMAPGEFEIVFTHRGCGMELGDRSDFANGIGADLFVSFHLNAATSAEAHGFEVFTTRGITGSDRVATILYNRIQDEFGNLFKPRIDWSDGDPDREANFSVLRRTTMRAVLLELGFITNRRDLDLLLEPSVQDRYTSALARGIVEAA